MSYLNLQNSYFSIPNPFSAIGRWLHPFRYRAGIEVRGKPCIVEWTRRAEKEFAKRGIPLIVEMQLYFSCVVKQRVLFHETLYPEAVRVHDRLAIQFHAVQSTSCDPVEFVEKYPVQRELDSPSALKWHPTRLQLDFVNGKWAGEFSLL